MKITPVKFQLELQDDGSRSAGLHLTNVTRDIAFRLGYLKPQYLTEDKNPTRMILGLAWEDYVFTHHHPEVAYHPGEVSLGGMAMTCDGISFLGDDRVVHECKLTWKSMAKEEDLEAEWLWLAQTKAYCAAWETCRARYHIYWTMGNYKYGTTDGGPQYRLYDLEFTARELQDNVTMLVNHARTIK